MSKLHSLLRVFEVAALLLIAVAFVQIAFDINKMTKGINVAATTEISAAIPINVNLTEMPSVEIGSVPMLDMVVNQ